MITKSVLLPCAPPRAFALFTDEISRWWPPERRHTGDADSAIVLSSSEFFERGHDGRVVELGAVRTWDPPHRLVLDWYPGTDAAHPTEVEIRFEPQGSSTLVVVEHRATAASEALFPKRATAYDASWNLVLSALLRAAQPPASS